MIKQGLEVKLGQSLSLTPQMQQAIRLLQMSSLDIHQEISMMVESNPMLEYSSDPMPSEPFTESQNSDDIKSYDSSSLLNTIPSDMSVDAEWQDIYHDYPKPNRMLDDASSGVLIEKLNAEKETLSEHLLRQIDLVNLSETDHMICQTIIAHINEKGYLEEDISVLYELFDEVYLIDLDEVVAMLHYIQSLDPVGVGAQSIGECLSLQIKALYADHAMHDKALILLDRYLDLLQKRDVASIKYKLKINDDEYEQLIALLKQLKAAPGDSFNEARIDYIEADVYIKKDINKQWVVSLNDKAVKAVQVNDYYAKLLKRKINKADKKYLKANLDEANWFIKSLAHRSNTILDVATIIMNKQQGFLQYGEVAMRPMVLKDIAELLDMHESTISRVTNNKYIHTPKGVYVLKYFFSSHVATNTGGECAATAIRAMIQTLVNEENRKKPLSDSKLVACLQAQGIKIARRTVAKYRESLSIAASRERKSLA